MRVGIQDIEAAPAAKGVFIPRLPALICCFVLAAFANAGYCLYMGDRTTQKNENDWDCFPTRDEKAAHVGFEALV